ncbi:MAG: hypothetical protein KGJ62_11055 [Armatimonadetes bacterium]|nr:hypothetical protein [Armatimonadota bacterium]MDE2206813.1 hypothetical protein [Armatimonadota bacterium]
MFPPTVFQCTPNFSAAREPAVVQAIVQSIAKTPGVCVIDWSADVEHNRSVVTFLAADQAVPAAAAAPAIVAARLIDLRAHTGAHPRFGAMDLFPVTPLLAESRPAAVELAMEAGRRISEAARVPIYWYGWCAQPARPADLPQVRRMARLWLRSDRTSGDAPDLAPELYRAETGITMVAARGPLAAWNVNLATEDIGIAREIVQRIRRSRSTLPELNGVRAMAVALLSRACVQVSMNVTRAGETPLPPIYRFIGAVARQLGCELLESEVVGVIPRAALGGEGPEAAGWRGYAPGQILETWEEAAWGLTSPGG